MRLDTGRGYILFVFGIPAGIIFLVWLFTCALNGGVCS